MFVGMREITSAKGRFGLIAGTVALITLLVVVLTGLTAGLGKQNTSALEALDPESVVFQDPEDISFTTSRVEARDGLTPLGASQMLMTKADGNDAAVAILSLPEGTELPGGAILGTEAVAAPGLNVNEGDTVTVAGNDITVGAIGEDLAFSHSPVLWVPTEFWQAAMHTDAVGTVVGVGRRLLGVARALRDVELDVIAAVILGGCSLFGGRGYILGTLFGSLIIGTLNNGLVLLGVSSPMQLVIKGAIIVAAVAFTKR